MSKRLDDVEQTPWMDVNAGAPQDAAEDQQVIEEAGHRSGLVSRPRCAARDRAIEQLRRPASAECLQIFLRLQHDTEGFVDRVRIERVPVERDERGHPIDGLRHSGHFVQVCASQLLNHGRHMLRQPCRRLGSALANDGQFFLERRVLNPLIKAPALERVMNLARAIGCEDDQWRLKGPHGPELGNGDLEFREQLEEEPFELLVGAIDLVDEQDGRARAGSIA
jgi:hypothetical protein